MVFQTCLLCLKLLPERRSISDPGSIAGDIAMKSLIKLCAAVLRDEQGGEMIEYGLIAGLLLIAALVAIMGVGNKVLGRWNTMNSSL